MAKSINQHKQCWVLKKRPITMMGGAGMGKFIVKNKSMTGASILILL